MEKLIIVEVDKNGWGTPQHYVFEEDYIKKEKPVVEAAYLPSTYYFDNETRKQFVEKFGFDPIDEEKLEEAKRNEDLWNEIEEFVEEKREIPRGLIPGSSLISKEELESIYNDGGITFDDILEYPWDEDTTEYDKYFVYWDGSNWRAIKIERMYEIEAEQIDLERDEKAALTTFTYKTKKGTEFKILSSWYQGTLDEIPEEDWAKIEDEAKEV